MRRLLVLVGLLLAFSISASPEKLRKLKVARDKAIQKERSRFEAAVERIDDAYNKAVKKLGGSAKSKQLKLIVWNCHNAGFKDRGAKALTIKGFSMGKEVWSRKVSIKWSPKKDYNKSLAVPYNCDEIKVIITKWAPGGGGLSEVEILDGSTNLAKTAEIEASGEYGGHPASNLVDGIKDSNKAATGYWLLPDPSAGWVSFKLSTAVGDPPQEPE